MTSLLYSHQIVCFHYDSTLISQYSFFRLCGPYLILALPSYYLTFNFLSVMIVYVNLSKHCFHEKYSLFFP